MNKLKQCGYNDEYECLVYFRIDDETGKQLWYSSWHEVQEFAEFPDLIDEFREQVRKACWQFDARYANLDSDDYWEWSED